MKQQFALVLILTLVSVAQSTCNKCYNQAQNTRCSTDSIGLQSYTLHMSVHPHLDAFWIFDFDSYYDPKPNQGNVHSYFSSNRFHSVKQIFDTTTDVLLKSKKYRETVDTNSQKAHRSFFNSEMGFFKRWYNEQNQGRKKEVQELLKTKYWEIVGGGFVEHDEGCAYYDDIIENYQTGLRFLQENFNYSPRAAVSADSFGHSQTTLAILAHIGVQGYFVERSDEHILLQNKTQFIWNAKSANGMVYGALPTHIRWAIHGFEDQFAGRGSVDPETICDTKGMYLGNMRRENEFLKRILKSTHIMRYFGHDFQRFDDSSYNVIEGFMAQFSREKCRKVSAVYGNPSEYFQILMGEVFNKVKPVATRNQDIFPIWDYDSGLYWTGYYTTDPYHKKYYRDAGRLLYAARKAFLPLYIADPKSADHVEGYEILEQLAETVAYLQHHDGISGTSKYSVMDEYELLAQKYMNKAKKKILRQMFSLEFPLYTNNPIFECSMENECTIPQGTTGDVYLKIFNSAGRVDHRPIIVHLNEGENFEPDCDYYEINCLCQQFPCPCDLYLYSRVFTYSIIKLKRVQNRPKDANILQKLKSDEFFSYNKTHFTITYNDKQYSIGYKRLDGDPTQRRYDHLSRYGDQVHRTFTIRSGKYALGNNPKTQAHLSSIRAVYKLQTDYLKKIIIKWNRQQMKTIITIENDMPNEWKVQTLSAAEAPKLQDVYLEVATSINNNKKFFTDSNGWLVMERTLFHHEDYSAHFSAEGFDDVDGNSYPMTAFCYIKDENNKVSINTDRPQGVIAYKPGTLWVNFDRLSSDDGKWVYETTYRNEYQKFVHYVTVQNKNNNERRIQSLYDQPLLIQGNQISPNERVQEFKSDYNKRERWAQYSGLQKVKLFVKPWNDSTVLMRVHNLHDEANQTVNLFSDKISPLLTTFYGNMIKFETIEEMSLGGNMKYEEFLKKKWNWDKEVKLREQNEIFNKEFGEKINLRPLEIRTFLLKGVKIDENCVQITQLKHSNHQQKFQLDLSKRKPLRTGKQRQDSIIHYLLNGDHCTQKSPVLKEVGVVPDKQPQISESTEKDQFQYNPQSVEVPSDKLPTDQAAADQTATDQVATEPPTSEQPPPDTISVDGENPEQQSEDIIPEPTEPDPVESNSEQIESVEKTRKQEEEVKEPLAQIEIIRGKIERKEELSRQQKIKYFKQKAGKMGDRKI